MKKENFLLIAILVLAAVLRLWNLTVPDLMTDDAVYSLRALGWVDYLASTAQTTPLQWFGSIPTWANLSFHDAPPLVFLIQHLFFFIFGDNLLGARLPFVFFGVGTVYLVYLLVKSLKSAAAGLLAALILAIFSLHIWISHLGFLEGVEIFFITLTVFFLVKFSQTKQKKFLYLLALSLGLTFLTKYTAFFLLPVILLYFLFFEKGIFKTKAFWLSVLFFILVISPVIIYNSMVFATRGHFDAALSSMVGMHPTDFQNLINRAPGGNPLINLSNLIKELFSLVSWPMLGLSFIAFLFLLVRLIVKKEIDKRGDILILASFILCLVFLSLGRLSSAHFLSLLTPWLAIILALAVFGLVDFLAVKWLNYAKKLVVVLLILVLGFELFYGINSHFLSPSLSFNPLVYSAATPHLNENLGFNQLDQYLRQNVFPQNLVFSRSITTEDYTSKIAENFFKIKTFYFIDEAVHWFAYTWYFAHYQLYYSLPIGSLYNAFKTAGGEDPIAMMRQQGIENFYFIYPVLDSAVDPTKNNQPSRQISIDFAKTLEERGIQPVEIKNHSGQVAFKVYKFN